MYVISSKKINTLGVCMPHIHIRFPDIKKLNIKIIVASKVNESLFKLYPTSSASADVIHSKGCNLYLLLDH